MIDINLRYAAPPIDFRLGIDKQLIELDKMDATVKLRMADFTPGDALLLLSKNYKQLRFVFKPVTVIEEAPYTVRAVKGFVMVHIRMSHQLDPRMLANVAEQAGLHLINQRRYESYFKDLQERPKAT